MANNSHDSDVAFIKALAELLRSNDLSDLEVKREYGEDDRMTVKVSRHIQATPVSQPAPQIAAAPAPTSSASPGPSPASDPAQLPGAVTSPMVGTCYLQAEPDTPAFVSVGDDVTEGQTLLIIEAMKTMNHIPAPKAGKVTRILVEDGTPVEYGAPLMVIE